MSHENFEAVKRLFAAFNAGRLDALIEASHPEGEVIPLRAALKGTAAFRAWNGS
jgi:hypothetical protein